MTIREALAQATHTLEAARIPDPRADAALLLSHVAGLAPLELSLCGQQTLTSSQERLFTSLLVSRTSRQPLQYLLGTQYFYGLPFGVDGRVLIPRPETETLCELALEAMPAVPAPALLDLCTGSGAIAVVMKRERPAAAVTATDISPQALSLARENARRNGVSIRFLEGDLFAPLGTERFHCILSNPPYIETTACQTLQEEVRFEPLLALDGGADGLAYYRRIAHQAASHLHPGGLLALEIGDTQGAAVCALLEETGLYGALSLHRDLAGLDRVILARALQAT